MHVFFSKEFGLESFISPTLLRNMREKDLRKALTGHMKKIQSLLEPRQKVSRVFLCGHKLENIIRCNIRSIITISIL